MFPLNVICKTVPAPLFAVPVLEKVVGRSANRLFRSADGWHSHLCSNSSLFMKASRVHLRAQGGRDSWEYSTRLSGACPTRS
ncbi:hypothetical protein V3C99_006011 [Haemonchus contortus]|uniref:Secreted protein n=1 Tax=Haemonchus contortus TaxID=6289 RepID=A0A7I4XSJ3_HAECO